MITFKSIHIRNFLSIETADLALENRGLLLISGRNKDDPSANSNGAGKSSIVDALSWCLYGVTARGQSGDSVINRTAGKNCRVRVIVEVSGVEYKLQRHRKDAGNKNRLHVHRGADDLTLGTDALTQELVIKLLGCSAEVFEASIYAGQGKMPNLPAMTDKALKEVVEQAAGVALLEQAYELAREGHNEVKRREAVIESQMNSKRAAAQSAAERVRAMTDKSGDFEIQRAMSIAKKEPQVAELMGKLRECKAKLAASPSLEDLERAIHEHRQAITNVKMPEAPVCEALEPPPLAPPRYEVLPAPESFHDAKQELKHWTAVSEKLRKEMETFMNEGLPPGMPCPTCAKVFEPGDEEHLMAEFGRRLKINEETLSDAQRGMDEEAEAYKKIILASQAEHQALVASIDREARAIAERNAARQEAHRIALEEHRRIVAAHDTTALVGQLAERQKQRDAVVGLQNLMQLIANQTKTLVGDIEKLKVAENPYAALVEEAIEAATKADYEAAADRLEYDCTVAERKHAIAAVELLGPKGIRGELLDSVTPYLNDRTGHYLNALSDGNISAEWRTIYTNDKGEAKEKFHIAVQNVYGAGEYEGLSGGEQRKVRISTALALQDLVASRAEKPINLFIADEVDDALDASGLERLMNILEAKARTTGTVLVISHNELSDWVPNELVIEKSGGVSRLVE